MSIGWTPWLCNRVGTAWVCTIVNARVQINYILFTRMSLMLPSELFLESWVNLTTHDCTFGIHLVSSEWKGNVGSTHWTCPGSVIRFVWRTLNAFASIWFSLDSFFLCVHFSKSRSVLCGLRVTRITYMSWLAIATTQIEILEECLCLSQPHTELWEKSAILSHKFIKVITACFGCVCGFTFVSLGFSRIWYLQEVVCQSRMHSIF